MSMNDEYGAFVGSGQPRQTRRPRPPPTLPPEDAPWTRSSDACGSYTHTSQVDSLGVVNISRERELHEKAVGSRRQAVQDRRERTTLPSTGVVQPYRRQVDDSALESELLEKAMQSRRHPIRAAYGTEPVAAPKMARAAPVAAAYEPHMLPARGERSAAPGYGREGADREEVALAGLALGHVPHASPGARESPVARSFRGAREPTVVVHTAESMAGAMAEMEADARMMAELDRQAASRYRAANGAGSQISGLMAGQFTGGFQQNFKDRRFA